MPHVDEERAPAKITASRQRLLGAAPAHRGARLPAAPAVLEISNMTVLPMASGAAAVSGARLPAVRAAAIGSGLQQPGFSPRPISPNGIDSLGQSHFTDTTSPSLLKHL